MAIPLPAFELADIRFDLLGRDDIDRIRAINRELFKEERIINHYHHPDIILITASFHEVIVGFKLGYGRKGAFYSAKSGVLEGFRRRGIARKMLYRMMSEVKKRGYKRLRFDTFPNKHGGMIILALNEGFKIIDARWNSYYNDFQIGLEVVLKDYPLPNV